MNPSERIDQMVAELTDWRGKTFAEVRKAVLAAEPGIVEEWKWMGSPVWEKHGIVAVCDAHKKWVKMTFQYGAFIDDPDKLFNNGFNGNQRRSIDFFEGDNVNAPALKALVRAAIAYNQSKAQKKPAAAAGAAKKAATTGASGVKKAPAAKKSPATKKPAAAKKTPAATRAKAATK